MSTGDDSIIHTYTIAIVDGILIELVQYYQLSMTCWYMGYSISSVTNVDVIKYMIYTVDDIWIPNLHISNSRWLILMIILKQYKSLYVSLDI
jgi:hypothetical protein